MEKTTELLNSREAQEGQSAQANGKVGISGVFKALLGWDAGASAEVSAGLSFNSSKIVKYGKEHCEKHDSDRFS